MLPPRFPPDPEDPAFLARARRVLPAPALFASVLTLVPTPGAADTHRLIPLKTPTATLPPSLALTLGPVISWNPDPLCGKLPTLHPPDCVLQGVMNFLTALLKDGPIASSNVLYAAQSNAISKSSLFRAKSELGILSLRDAPGKPWRWALPGDTRPIQKAAPSIDLDDLEQALSMLRM
jgi:hypothetical protein